MPVRHRKEPEIEIIVAEVYFYALDFEKSNPESSRSA
jgi:hypothetical protein